MGDHMQFTEILERFKQVTEETDGYLALCPSHGDSRPSLRIWCGENGTVRLACRAGCNNSDVVKAAGLRWPDMFKATGDGRRVPTARPKLVGPGHIAALAMYLDAAGAAIDDFPAMEYVQHRFGISRDLAEKLGLGFDNRDGFDFRYVGSAYTRFPRLVVPLNDFQGNPRGLQGRDLSGDCPVRWMSPRNPEGMRWAPYGVFRGSGGHGVTIVSEGPSDGLTVASAGYDAVAIRGAALVNDPELVAELAAGLKGQRVVAAGDNDTAGRHFNKTLAAGLKPFGVDVRSLPIPDLGPKSDLADWRASDPQEFAANLHSAVRQCGPVRENKARMRRMEALLSATLGDTA